MAAAHSSAPCGGIFSIMSNLPCPPPPPRLLTAAAARALPHALAAVERALEHALALRALNLGVAQLAAGATKTGLDVSDACMQTSLVCEPAAQLSPAAHSRCTHRSVRRRSSAGSSTREQDLQMHCVAARDGHVAAGCELSHQQQVVQRTGSCASR